MLFKFRYIQPELTYILSDLNLGSFKTNWGQTDVWKTHPITDLECCGMTKTDFWKNDLKREFSR